MSARVSGCGCGNPNSQCGHRGCHCGPDHFTTISNEVIGLTCGCGWAHSGPHCQSCQCCGCQDLRALAAAPAVVAGFGRKAVKKPIVYTVGSCHRCGPNRTSSARVSGCSKCARRDAAKASGLGHYTSSDGKHMFRFAGADGFYYEGEVAGGSAEHPSLINIRRIS